MRVWNTRISVGAQLDGVQFWGRRSQPCEARKRTSRGGESMGAKLDAASLKNADVTGAKT